MMDMLEDYFKEILDRFEDEKTKPFKGNELVLKIRNDLSKEVSNCLDNTFTVRTHCGLNSWPKSPWITIIDKSFDSAQEALILQYNFDTLKRHVSFSLILRLKDVSEYTSIKNFLIMNIKNSNLNDFTVDENDTSNIILSKNYTYNQINDDVLKGDLERIIPTYRHLSYCFKSFGEEDDMVLCDMAFDDYSYIDDDAYFDNVKCDQALIHQKVMKKSIADISVEYLKESKYENNINSPQELLTDEVINLIIKCDITHEDYSEILSDIRKNSRSLMLKILNDNDLDLNELKIKDKILLYSKSFTKTEYKSVGKLLGSYSFNKIRIDDRLPTPLIITSIIHELSHFLLEKILKEVMMKILNTNDTPLISSYVKILLEDNDLNYLLDEFSAHTVEGRFALYGYQDYASFKYKFDEISHLYSKEDIDYALILANTFAYDIKDILEEYIDEDLREEIKDEFLRLNDRPQYEQLDFEIESRLSDNDFTDALALILTSGIGEAINQKDKLSRYMERFKII